MVSGTNDRFLNAEAALTIAYEKAEPYLQFIDVVNPIAETESGFVYLKNDTSKSRDSKKKKPAEHLLGGLFPEVDRSRKTSASEIIEAQGFSMRIPRNVLRSKIGASEIMDCYETAGFWLAELTNTNILSGLTSNATTSFSYFSSTAEWSDTTNATPVLDLMDFAQDMKAFEGKPYRMNMAYVDTENFHELKKLLAGIDYGEFTRNNIVGAPNNPSEMINIPMFGTVQEVVSGMTEGYILGMDTRNIRSEIHYYNDPAFSVPTFTYQTNNIATGAPETRTVPNLGYNFYQYEEDDTHDTILQFWVENTTVVKDDESLLYGSGI
jgi:hypothetical protein